MNELEQLEKRLLEIDKLFLESIEPPTGNRTLWKWAYYEEAVGLVEVLDLLDPCWIDELKIYSKWIKEWSVWYNE